MKTSDSLKEFAPAFAKAQSGVKNALKDSTNPHFKSKYADLTAVWDACREALTSNGIGVIQEVVASGEGVGVVTRLLHSSGEWIECGPLIVPLSKRDAQGVGSATTYAKRYALAAAVGVATEDDDGNDAASKGGWPAGLPTNGKEPEPVKQAPGVSAARQWVAQATREVMAASDASSLMAFLNTPDVEEWTIKIRNTWPDLWSGPEDSGWRAMVLQAATNCSAMAEVKDWIARVVAKAQGSSPKQAA